VTEEEACVLPVVADATDRTRAEQIRLQYAAIVESSDDAIVAKTLDGVISAWNAAAERMFGYTEHEAIGQSITMIIPPDLYDEERDILKRLRAGERVEHCESAARRAGAFIASSLTAGPRPCLSTFSGGEGRESNPPGTFTIPRLVLKTSGTTGHLPSPRNRLRPQRRLPLDLSIDHSETDAIVIRIKNNSKL
jgi:PAS domain S-box-containing protein